MKKVLCDKDGEFISIHDEDYYLMELNDGDYLTHEDGTILIYRECEREDIKVAYHALLRYGENYIRIKTDTRLPIMTLSRLIDSLH